MRKQLSWKFNNEESFSDYIKEYQLDRISTIIGKTFIRSTCEREKKADYGDHDGTLRVDLCIETCDGNYVIIENQYNRTNHDHFGKLFTYATMLTEENHSVSDAVWIVERVREEHYNAVNIINDMLEKKGINFKIWLLVAVLSNKGINNAVDEETIILRFPTKEDFFIRGSKDYDDPEHKAELDEYMPMLIDAIRDELTGWNNPRRPLSTPHCIGVTSNRAEPYDYNIPFRVKEKYIKVEARFKDEFYKRWIEKNWQNVIDEIDDNQGELVNYIQLYSVNYEITQSYIKVYGSIKADITNEDKWSYYTEQVIDLIRVIEFLCARIERI